MSILTKMAVIPLTTKLFVILIIASGDLRSSSRILTWLAIFVRGNGDVNCNEIFRVFQLQNVIVFVVNVIFREFVDAKAGYEPITNVILEKFKVVPNRDFTEKILNLRTSCLN